ncbi:XRP2 [Brachionus plicatilis]|uniref:Protein XRP2 n=1 Tax=Brachionus plicatilis TaxID=10195 RepID=A0A3M7SEZ8_BRAPC|nr:XRP2 [Brachionus plicatilis]
MGCLFTSPYSPLYYLFPQNSNQSKEEQPKVYSWDIREKVDPKDYSIENQQNEVIIKLPGSINGMQFIIQNLENCVVYLFDNVAQVSIDDCKNCKFFIGPSKGSVFIRDCSDCCLAAVCQQFRTRDCRRINTFLSCGTQPIIESSTYMKFACLTVNYAQLPEQLKNSRISVFNNNWNNIHDFTPVPGEQNFSFFNQNTELVDYVPLPDKFTCNQLKLFFSKAQTLIPLSVGPTSRSNNESVLVIFFSPDSTGNGLEMQESQASRLINEIRANYSDILLIQTKRYELSELSAENIFKTKSFNNFLKNGPIIGLEFNGYGCSQRCQDLVNSLSLKPSFVSEPSPSLSHQIDAFYNFADMQMSV